MPMSWEAVSTCVGYLSDFSLRENSKASSSVYSLGGIKICAAGFGTAPTSFVALPARTVRLTSAANK